MTSLVQAMLLLVPLPELYVHVLPFDPYKTHLGSNSINLAFKNSNLPKLRPFHYKLNECITQRGDWFWKHKLGRRTNGSSLFCQRRIFSSEVMVSRYTWWQYPAKYMHFPVFRGPHCQLSHTGWESQMFCILPGQHVYIKYRRLATHLCFSGKYPALVYMMTHHLTFIFWQDHCLIILIHPYVTS